MDLSALLLLNLSAAASRRGTDLHGGCYNVISFSLSILTADCTGNVLRRGWELSLNTNTQTHTLRHSGVCRGSLGAISLLAILLMLASLMIVNVFSWTLRTVFYHLAFTSLCGRSLSSSLYKPNVDSHVLTSTRGHPAEKQHTRRECEFKLSSGHHYSTISLHWKLLFAAILMFWMLYLSPLKDGCHCCFCCPHVAKKTVIAG